MLCSIFGQRRWRLGLILLPTIFAFTLTFCQTTILEVSFWIREQIESGLFYWDSMGVMKSRLPGDKHVVIIGAGYAGSSLARDLMSRRANFTIVDHRDSLHHNIATARALVQPAMVKQIFINYNKTFGSHFKQGRVADLKLNDRRVLLQSGEVLPYDVLVLATGAYNNFPSKLTTQSTEEGVALYANLHDKIQNSDSILLIGGGGAGVELSAEIKVAFPQKHVTLVHAHEELVTKSSSQAFQTRLREILKETGVRLILGERLLDADVRDGAPLTTDKGTKLSADLILRTTGSIPNTDIFSKSLSSSINKNGQIMVDEYLQVQGQKDVFAIGDCCDTRDFKFARSAQAHAKLLAFNLAEKFQENKLKPYSLGSTEFYHIGLALGPTRALGMKKDGTLRDEAGLVREKSQDLMLGRLYKLMGQSLH